MRTAVLVLGVALLCLPPSLLGLAIARIAADESACARLAAA